MTSNISHWLLNVVEGEIVVYAPFGFGNERNGRLIHIAFPVNSLYQLSNVEHDDKVVYAPFSTPSLPGRPLVCEVSGEIAANAISAVSVLQQLHIHPWLTIPKSRGTNRESTPIP